jgi:Pentapeptide repeats (8 copies)
VIAASWRLLRWPLSALSGLALVLLLLWALVTVPALILGVDQVQMVRKITDPSKQLDEVNGLRSTLAAVLAGLAVAAGAVVGALNFRETSRQNRALLELQRRGQVTERFTKAIEQLGQRGDEKLDVRIGAVYALEQIARDSVELHWPIVEVLTAYLREHASVTAGLAPGQPAAEASAPDGTTPGSDAPTRRLPADHQAIATVIGRRSREQDPDGQYLDLDETDLPQVHWREAHLEGADLREAHLEGAYLIRAHVERASLNEAHLELADLFRARLEWAYLFRAHLERASLSEAHLEGARLSGAHLEGADLRDARGLTREQLGAATDPELAHLSVEQAAWLESAAGTPEPGREVTGGSVSE